MGGEEKEIISSMTSYRSFGIHHKMVNLFYLNETVILTGHTLSSDKMGTSAQVTTNICEAVKGCQARKCPKMYTAHPRLNTCLEVTDSASPV